jgi:hypothetical protein
MSEDKRVVVFNVVVFNVGLFEDDDVRDVVNTVARIVGVVVRKSMHCEHDHE